MNAPDAAAPFFHLPNVRALEVVARLYAQNPFEPAWAELHREALGDDYVPGDEASLTPEGTRSRNREALAALVAVAVAVAQQQLAAGARPTARELATYRGAALYTLWDDFGPRLQRLIDEDTLEVPFWDAFLARHRAHLSFPGLTVPAPEHLLAIFYQARRAFHFAKTRLAGGSPSIAAARAAVWRASLGSDADAYAGGLYLRMDEIPVLVTGETGTGKDIAAQCLGASRYIPFDAAARRFACRHDADYHARNLSEIPREMVASALFGHKRGAFTGATADAPALLGLPRRNGTLFLDEIGELLLDVQAKLLRPLESRVYVPLGDTREHPILGRIVSATLRDLDAMCEDGSFRLDLLQRLSGVRVPMPPLRRILRESPAELDAYVRRFVAEKLGDPAHVDATTDRVLTRLRGARSGYVWPGNLRELRHETERALLGEPMEAPRRSDTPPSACIPSSGILGPRAKAGEVTADEVMRSYMRRLYEATGENASETARLTGLDRRTVARWLERIRGQEK